MRFTRHLGRSFPIGLPGWIYEPPATRGSRRFKTTDSGEPALSVRERLFLRCELIRLLVARN